MLAQNRSSLIQASCIDDQVVVDSRLIAAQLQIQHKNFLATIDKYFDRMAANPRLKAVAFQTREFKTAQGNISTERWAWLTEVQSTFIMSLSKNTDAVVDCKEALSIAFIEAKQIIPQQNTRIRELELEVELAGYKKVKSDRQDLRIALHGVATTLLLEGKQDSVVTVPIPTLEVINQNTNVRYKGQTLTQVAETMLKLHGIKFKSGAEVKRWLIDLDKHGLISQAQRSIPSDYVPDEYLEEVYQALLQNNHQLLLGQ